MFCRIVLLLKFCQCLAGRVLLSQLQDEYNRAI